jgi:putative phosphoesterase
MHTFRSLISVGLVSDSHGLLRQSVVTALRGVELILHAGDIGKSAVLDGLRVVAPVIAVRGNVDRNFAFLPNTELVSINGRLIHLLHDLSALDFNPVSSRVAAVVAGHSHQPRMHKKGGVWYINPGSIGPRRFKLPIALVKLQFEAGVFVPELIELPE